MSDAASVARCVRGKRFGIEALRRTLCIIACASGEPRDQRAGPPEARRIAVNIAKLAELVRKQ